MGCRGGAAPARAAEPGSSLGARRADPPRAGVRSRYGPHRLGDPRDRPLAPRGGAWVESRASRPDRAGRGPRSGARQETAADGQEEVVLRSRGRHLPHEGLPLHERLHPGRVAAEDGAPHRQGHRGHGRHHPQAQEHGEEGSRGRQAAQAPARGRQAGDYFDVLTFTSRMPRSWRLSRGSELAVCQALSAQRAVSLSRSVSTRLDTPAQRQQTLTATCCSIASRRSVPEGNSLIDSRWTRLTSRPGRSVYSATFVPMATTPNGLVSSAARRVSETASVAEAIPDRPRLMPPMNGATTTTSSLPHE